MNKKLLRKKLALMLATLKKKQKYYCECEYLQPQTMTSPNKYTTRIDTGISPTANTEVIAEIEPLDNNAGDQTIGARTGTGNANRFFVYAMTLNGRVVMGSNSKENLYLTGTRFKIKFNETNTHNVYVNDTLITTFDASKYTNANDNHLLLFATTGYEPSYGTSNTRIYRCQIREAGVLVRDFIPVLDWDMTPCMYDKVTEQLFYNVGSGNLVAGRQIHPVEYLESTGTQYIDTGITINTSTDEVVSDFQLISTTLYQWIMGEHDNGARFGIGVGDGTNKRNVAYGATTYKVQDVQVYNEKHNFKANSNGVFLDDVQIHGYENFASTSTVYLFGLNHSGANGAAGKIWNYKHKRNGTLVRDFIPAIDENDTYFMFDRVSHTCYNNAGSGSFMGPTVQKDGNGKIIENEYE